MAEKDKDRDEEHDLDALAALVRPSAAPPVARNDEGEAAAADGDGDDSVLDLRALATSTAPPPSDEPVRKPAPPAEAAREGGSEAPKPKTGDKPRAKEAKPDRAAAPRQETAPVTAEPARKSSAGIVAGVLFGAAIAAGAVLFLSQKDAADESEPDRLAAAEPRSLATTSAVAAHGEVRANDATEAEAPTPAADEAASAEAAVAAEALAEPETPAAASAAPEPSAREARAGRREARAARGARRQARAESEQPSAPAGDAPDSEPAPAAGGQAAGSAQATGSAQAAASGGGDNSRLDSVLDDALGGGSTAGGAGRAEQEAASPAPADMPDTPSRGDVARSLGRLLPQIRQCAGDQVGMANATILVRNDGTVGSVAIGGHPFGGTPQGACMEGVIRGAQFPRFRQSTFRITYPFAIRATQ